MKRFLFILSIYIINKKSLNPKREKQLTYPFRVSKYLVKNGKKSNFQKASNPIIR